jgi:hypothetical protein
MVHVQYACLIYVDPSYDTPEETLGEYMALSENAVAKGIMRGGERLADVGTATTVRIRDGKRTVTDGPFAETKEILGGFMVFECPSLDEAIEWASKIPGARHGSVEVRPVIERGG